jgi:hypothetical protein
MESAVIGIIEMNVQYYDHDGYSCNRKMEMSVQFYDHDGYSCKRKMEMNVQYYDHDGYHCKRQCWRIRSILAGSGSDL